MVAAARAAGEDVSAGLAMADRFGVKLPNPGGGATALRWRLLAEVAAQDLTAGRILEAHSDALAILAEAGQPAPSGSWGVFAAEAPNAVLVANADADVAGTAVAGTALADTALADTATADLGGWTVDGTKPWCSLAGVLDHALVTAHVGSGRQLFAVDLRQESVRAEPPSGWVARGLRAVPSGPVHFAQTPARPVGEPGWYLTRPGFAWGGIGVAACWFGGASALAGRLHTAAAKRGGELIELAVGRVDVALHTAGAALADAARRVDAGQAEGDAGETLALRVRSAVAAAAEETLTQVGHVLGPAPLAFDETYARRVADLELYIRQHHAERDLAALGRRVVACASGSGS